MSLTSAKIYAKSECLNTWFRYMLILISSENEECLNLLPYSFYSDNFKYLMLKIKHTKITEGYMSQIKTSRFWFNINFYINCKFILLKLDLLQIVERILMKICSQYEGWEYYCVVLRDNFLFNGCKMLCQKLNAYHVKISGMGRTISEWGEFYMKNFREVQVFFQYPPNFPDQNY